MESGFRFNSGDKSYFRTLCRAESDFNVSERNLFARSVQNGKALNNLRFQNISRNGQNVLGDSEILSPIEPDPLKEQGNKQQYPETISALNRGGDTFQNNSENSSASSQGTSNDDSGDITLLSQDTSKNDSEIISVLNQDCLQGVPDVISVLPQDTRHYSSKRMSFWNRHTFEDPFRYYQHQNGLNIYNGWLPPTYPFSDHVSVKIDGLYSPTKLIPMYFRKNRYLQELPRTPVEGLDTRNNNQNIQRDDVNIIVGGTGEHGTIRLIKTLTRNEEIKLVPLWLAFKKDITKVVFPMTMKVWLVKGLIQNLEKLRTCKQFARSVIVIVYDVTDVDCIQILSRLISAVKNIVASQMPIILVGNTSNVKNQPKDGVITSGYLTYIKDRYRLLAYHECSVESFTEVDALFVGILNTLFPG